MSKFAARLLTFLLVLTISSFVTPKLLAAQFTDALLRLDDIKLSAPLSGLVCVTPASTATEGKVSLTFSSAFTLSPNASDYSLSSEQLPSGSTSWPGISSTATTVSSHTVTFTSADLDTGIKYCFSFTAHNSTTASTVGNYTTTVTTQTATGTPIDSSTIGTMLSNSDQVVLSATVPATPTDYTVWIEKTSPAEDTVSQNQDMNFVITYKSLLPYTSPLTLQASWSLGTVNGDTTPSVDIVSYIPGSASKDYAETPAIIDPVNRTITWTEPAYPGGAPAKTVYFRLRTSNFYRGQTPVYFNVSARVIGISTQSLDSTVNLAYDDSSRTKPLVTITPVPPSPTPYQSPTPTPTPPPLLLYSVNLYSISMNSAVVSVDYSLPAVTTLLYGTNPASLIQRLKTASLRTNDTITLPDLTPGTTYYFKVIGNSSNKSTGSDIYTFRTATSAELAHIDESGFIVTSGQTIVYSPAIHKALQSSVILLPTDTATDVQASLLDSSSVQRSQLVLQYRSDSSFLRSYDLLETKPGVMTTKLTSPIDTGSYDVYLRVFDSFGNIAMQKIAVMRVSTPLQVLSKRDHKPIESATVRLSVLNEKTKLYEELTGQFFSGSYPLRTSQDGLIQESLPPGSYLATVSAVGFKPVVTPFIIGAGSDEQYPTILLEDQPITPLTLFFYFKDSLQDFATRTSGYLSALQISHRFFELINLIGIMVFLSLAVLALSERIGLPIMHLPLFFRHHIAGRLRDKSGDKSLRGVLTNALTNKPIAGAHVFLVNSLTRTALDSTLTDSRGVFHFTNLPPGPIGITCLRNGYFAFYHVVHLTADHEVDIALTPQEKAQAIPRILLAIIEQLGERAFELLLVAAVGLQLLFGYYFGWQAVSLFLLLSLTNLAYFTYYHRITTS